MQAVLASSLGIIFQQLMRARTRVSCSAARACNNAVVTKMLIARLVVVVVVVLRVK